MKNLRFILLFVFLCSFGTLFAQWQLFFSPSTTDNFISTGTITNTGCDTREFFDQGWDMDVMVWDQSSGNGMFAWNCSNSDGSFALDGGTAVEDPDLVVGLGDDTFYALVVYEISGNIYYETWYYDDNSSTWVNQISSTALTSSGDCDNPNVDIDQNSDVVAVWDDGGVIRAVTGDVVNGLNTPKTVYTTGTNSVPDVCIHTNDYGTNVGFTYLNFDGTNFFLLQQDEDYTRVSNGTMYQNPISLKSADPSTNGQAFGRPRIAAPNLIEDADLGDHEIVVIFSYQPTMFTYSYQLYGFNTCQGSDSYVIVNNQLSPSAGNLTGEPNFEPVVAYHREQDIILVAWTYYDFYRKYGSYYTYDVLVRHLSYDGSLINWPNNNPWYSIINYTELGIQKTPSIAQRFGYGGNQMLFVYDDVTNGLAYKRCTSENYIFRKKNPDLNDIENDSPFQYSIYPNPNSIRSLTIDLSNYDTQTKVLIFDSQGRKINDKKLVSESSVIDLNSLSQGLYIVKLFANNKIYTEKLSIIE